jgi:small subunit ribosomal protein S8
MTDPIADMLSRVRNATTAFKEEVRMPSSKLKMAIADILKREGYIDDFGVESGEHGPILKIDLKYGPGRHRTIAGLKRISKPGLRVYAGRDDLPRVLGGLGIAIISTSQGVMTDRQAARARVGGEVLCYVW